MEKENEKIIYEIDYTTQFKKDYKKFKNNSYKLEKIANAIKLLEAGGIDNLPQSMKPHSLIGNYKNHFECHIESNLLLIWLQYDEIEKRIVLVRLGSHSELFRK